MRPEHLQNGYGAISEGVARVMVRSSHVAPAMCSVMNTQGRNRFGNRRRPLGRVRGRWRRGGGEIATCQDV